MTLSLSPVAVSLLRTRCRTQLVYVQNSVLYSQSVLYLSEGCGGQDEGLDAQQAEP